MNIVDASDDPIERPQKPGILAVDDVAGVFSVDIPTETLPSIISVFSFLTRHLYLKVNAATAETFTYSRHDRTVSLALKSY